MVVNVMTVISLRKIHFSQMDVRVAPAHDGARGS
jgi:hypothetical protein